jgi:hypothetical protein
MEEYDKQILIQKNISRKVSELQEETLLLGISHKEVL